MCAKLSSNAESIQNHAVSPRREVLADGVDLWFGDCREVLPLLDAVDCVIGDPPYGTTSNKWDSVIPFDFLWPQLWRVVRNPGAVVFTASQPFTSLAVCSQIQAFKHEWIWLKNRGSNFANTIREPMKEHESVLVFSKGKWKYNKQMQERTGAGASRVKHKVAFRSQSENYRAFYGREPAMLPEMRVPSSWQKFNTATDGFHPTQKPVELMEYLIRTYSDAGDSILDFAMGSGTTGVAAVNLGRKFIGVEVDRGYFDISRRRISEALKMKQETFL